MQRHGAIPILLLVWLPIAVGYPLAISRGLALDFWSVLPFGAASATVVGLLGLGIWVLTSKLEFPSRPGLLFYSGLPAIALVNAVIWVGAVTVLQGWSTGRTPAGALQFALQNKWLQWDMLFGFAFFGLLTGTCYALRAQESLARERLSASQAAELATAARLRALQARLKPHFLLNALHSLSELVRESPAEGESALDRLGNVMRYLVDRGDTQHVSLGEELDFARDYLAIERFRFGSRLRVEEHVDPVALNTMVPTFSVQSLVENALRHGVGPLSKGGTVWIRVWRTSNAVNVQVQDDGVGADPDRVGEGGLGLAALPLRLQNLTAGPGTLAVECSPGDGFLVTLKIPNPDPPSEPPVTVSEPVFGSALRVHPI